MAISGGSPNAQPAGCEPELKSVRGVRREISVRGEGCGVLV